MRSEPGKASGGGGGETKVAWSMRARCQTGMRRGRVVGSAKKAKTVSTG
jgi:hypothetical protein